MLAKLVFAILATHILVIHIGNAGTKDSLVVNEDFRVGETLRYTTDVSVPDRPSRFVVARLSRPGYLPSEVKTLTVYVADSLATSQVKWKRDDSSQK